MRVILLAAFGAVQSAAPQTSDSTARARVAEGAIVSGVVHDSLAGAPLASAVVQLVLAGGGGTGARTVMADSAGRFALTDVPDGRYLLGFFHARLDSLGVQSPLREVDVAGGRPVHADLAIPAAHRLRGAICGALAVPDTASAVIVGVVRDAETQLPISGASVVAQWLEIAFRDDGIHRRVARREAATRDGGWFALCGIPRSGIVMLSGSRGADSSGLLDLDVPPDGFLWQELAVATARSGATGVDLPGDSATLTEQPLPRRSGGGRVSGTVVTAADGRPLANARVTIREGPETRANDEGEFSFTNAPLGTRMIEVRAVGFYPERRPVTIRRGGSGPPLRIALPTLRAVLDTVHVTATALARVRRGFEERRLSGAGYYLGAQQIARRAPFVASDLFRVVPGVTVDRVGVSQAVRMRSLFSSGVCTPAFYLNGMLLNPADVYGGGAGIVFDIDDWISPRDIVGVEVYTESTAPSEFQAAMSGCGSIVIWTR